MIRAHDHHFAAKVADFDFIQNCYDDNRVLLKRRGVCATPAYRSPEVLEKILIDDTRAPDVYAIGVVFYMLLTFHRPFPQYDYKDENVVKQRIEDIRKSFDGMFDLMPNVDHNSKAIDGFVRVLRKLLNPDYKVRESLDSILKDPFFGKSEKPPNDKRVLTTKVKKLYLF